MIHTTASFTGTGSLCLEPRPEIQKPYSKPEIILELELETRAGSPLGIPDPMYPFSLNTTDLTRPDR
ncbi:MAG: hypothetical protein ACE5HA_18400 [Anaerolineae bacterium]